jgi:pimeloyl-ACP methyl ester carboxylesterase
LSEESPAFEDGYFTVTDGIRLHYRDYPGADDLPPLLCLHGLTRNARDFAHLAERHSPQFRVLVLEFRGRGDSEPDPQPGRYNPLTYAGDVIALLDHIGIDRAIFVATSLGGVVAMAVAAIAPQRIAGSIVNDVGPEFGKAGIDRIMTYLGRGLEFDSWDDAARAIASHQGPSFPNYGHADWVAMAKRNCRERNGRIVFDYDQAIAEPFRAGGSTPNVDLWQLFRALGAAPMLIVRGEISQLLSAETAARMRREVPAARFVEVPHTGHAPELDEPAAEAAIDSFLADFAADLRGTSA